MAEIVCRLCGATGDSKCPYCRSVFPDDQHDAIMSHLLKFDIKTDERTKLNWLEVSWYMGDGTQKDNVAWGLKKLKEALNDLDIDRYACDHQWVFAPGAKSSIGCGHENRE